MQTSFFSLTTDGRNDQNLENMNPVTIRIFYINQHKIVGQIFNICFSRTATTLGFFYIIESAMSKYKILWENCI